MLFGFQDGKIEQICAHDEDDIWVVNVKRGLISMIQNSMDDMSSSSFVHEVKKTNLKNEYNFLMDLK